MVVHPGDKFTIAGVYEMIPNPNRRWWQWWRPRKVASDRLAEFRATSLLGKQEGEV